MENNLNLYHIFFMVAECGNISAAAKKLYISQPAISKAISKLEQNLNTVLFLRNSRGVNLTPEGELLYEQVTFAFNSIRKGEERIQKINALGIGHLSIGVSTTLCKYILLPYLKEFVKDYPHIQIAISCQSSFETIQALEKGNIDIGLVGIPDTSKTLSFTPLKEIQDIFVATGNYMNNLKIREGQDRNSILQTATFMLLNKENLSRKYIDHYLTLNHIDISNIIEVNNMDLLIDFAKIDLGIACVISEFVKKELQEQSLIEVPLGKSFPKRKIGFACSDSILKENPVIHDFIAYGQKL